MNGAGDRQVIRAGTVLWRVHDSATPPDEVNSAGAWFSENRETALVRELLPDPRFNSFGFRTIPFEMLGNRVASALRVRAELVVLQAPAEDVAAGRARDDVQGVSVRSELTWPGRQLMLFGDRCPAVVLEPVPGERVWLDSPEGHTWLTDALAPYRIEVRPGPRKGAPLVFVNYRTSGGTREVDLLDEELRLRLGEDAVFRDCRMKAGVGFPGELIGKARDAKVLLAIVGPHWEENYDAHGTPAIRREDDWVRIEIREAFARGRTVVPLLVGAREPLSADSLPDDVKALADLQFLQLYRNATRTDVAQVIDKLFAEVPELRDAPRVDEPEG